MITGCVQKCKWSQRHIDAHCGPELPSAWVTGLVCIASSLPFFIDWFIYIFCLYTFFLLVFFTVYWAGMHCIIITKGLSFFIGCICILLACLSFSVIFHWSIVCLFSFFLLIFFCFTILSMGDCASMHCIIITICHWLIAYFLLFVAFILLLFLLVFFCLFSFFWFTTPSIGDWSMHCIIITNHE